MNHYFYIDVEGKQKGTFSPEELRLENIRRDTLVWTQGMEQWKRAEEVEELSALMFNPSTQINDAGLVEEAQHLSAKSAHELREPMPKTWLVESILITLLPFVFCGSFLSLLGIIAIVNATQVESYYNRGNYTASLDASRAARKWTKITFWVFIVWTLLFTVTLLLLFGLLGFSLTGISELINV